MAVFSLSSCIEGEEEIWIHSDGSGRAQFTISAPTLLFAKLGDSERIMAIARRTDEASEAITLLSLEEKQVGTRTTFFAEISFQDAREIRGFLKSFRDAAFPEKKSQVESIVGELSLDIGFPNTSFQRQLDFAPLLAEQSVPPFALNLLGEEARLRYILHLPSVAKSHNADLISDDGKTLQWDFPINRLLREPVEMGLTIGTPLPFGRLTLLALMLLLVVLLLIWLIKNRHRLKNSPSTLSNSPS